MVMGMAKGDLISRKALLKELRAELRECRADADEFGGENILWAEGIEFAIDTVKQTMAVDAVEVVRCKDCDFACEGSYGLVCTAWGARTDYDMFCGNGERREGE